MPATPKAAARLVNVGLGSSNVTPSPLAFAVYFASAPSVRSCTVRGPLRTCTPMTTTTRFPSSVMTPNAGDLPSICSSSWGVRPNTVTIIDGNVAGSSVSGPATRVRMFLKAASGLGTKMSAARSAGAGTAGKSGAGASSTFLSSQPLHPPSTTNAGSTQNAM